MKLGAKTSTKTSRSVVSILRENIFTLFNFMLFALGVLVLLTRSYKDLLFLVVIVANIAIGVTTEVKAKRALDKLQILISAKYRASNLLEELVKRPEQAQMVEMEDLQKGQFIVLSAGDQVPADCKIVHGEAEVDESMLTGESHSIFKKSGDEVLSGTTVVSGQMIGQIDEIGANAKVAKLTESAKVFKLAHSDLRAGVNTILKWISIAIIPALALLILTQFYLNHDITTFESWSRGILRISAGAIGMIPEGLVLLTSMNFALAVLILSKKNVLVTELNSVETLARVNEIILDKTGTITDGTVVVSEITAVDVIDAETSEVAFTGLRTVANLPGGTKTSDAILDYLDDRGFSKAFTDEQVVEKSSFSSVNKSSSVAVKCLHNGREVLVHFILGAPEILLNSSEQQFVRAQEIVNVAAKNGCRMLVFVQTAEDKTTVFVIKAQEHIRKSAKEIINYFQNSGVRVQIVSGDSENTVRYIGEQVGVTEVIGRALPETKLEVVQKLQDAGKVVAMTGDGVNDILALKNADLGIVIANAAPACKAVANLVLVDSDFGHLPAVLAQGRRIIANIERVASLFLVKTFYSIGLTVLTIATNGVYPFYPRHLTVVSALTIGLPAFLLSLGPNNQKYKPGFLRCVLKFSVPWGIAIALLVESVWITTHDQNNSLVVLSVMAFVVLMIKARPLFSWRGIVVALVAISFVLFILFDLRVYSFI
ncbi:MAG: HAD-IC family P-type ATPase [Candidatus Ancillula trichonymphae]|jgi:cation-transporting ATPase E|nr:HAD-IC family P-type ATPase [Candidatus Ancillula trichonymphae]